MTPLERKKMEVELINVHAARQNMELRIMEREEDIANLKAQMEIQMVREKELKEKLGEKGA